MIGQEQFHDRSPLPLDLLVRGLDVHALGHGRGARRHRPGHALCLDQAEPATAVWLQPRIVAERRNVNVIPPGCFKNGSPVRHSHLLTVDRKIYHSITLFDRLELARLEAGPALDADILNDLVRFFLLADDSPRRTDARAGSTALAELLKDAVGQEILADSRRTPLLVNVRLVLFPVVLDRGQHRIGSGLSQTAERGGLYVAAQALEQIDVSFPALAFGDPGQDLEQPLRADPAGNAFAAGFRLGELQEVFRDVHHAVGLIEHDHAARAHDRARPCRATRSPASYR